MITRIFCAHLAGPDGGVALRVRGYAVTLCAACWRALGSDRTASRAGKGAGDETGVRNSPVDAPESKSDGDGPPGDQIDDRRGSDPSCANRANGPAITISPLLQWGQACLDGTRLTLSALLARVASEGREAAKADWDLTDDQIDVALWFAAAYQLRRRKGFAAALEACPVYRRAWGVEAEQP